MKTTPAFLTLFLCLVLTNFANGQTENDIEHVIESEAFETERKVYVHLPDRYFTDTTTTFSIAIVLDGHYQPFWRMAKSNIGYQVQSHCVIPMIAVGIHSDNRGSEFSPPPTELLDHLENEVIPLIESSYRVGGIRIIIGHSWGGAFVGHTLISDRSHLFDAYIGISPSFGYDEGQFFPAMDSLLQAGHHFGKFVYGSSGDVGYREADYGGYVAKMDSLVQAHPNESLAWAKATFPGTDHWSCVIPSFSDGLIKMSRHYWVDQVGLEQLSQEEDSKLRERVAAIDASRQATFGYHYESGPRYLRFVGNDLSEQEQPQQAIQLFEWALELEPDNLRINMSIAEAYEEIGELDKALLYFESSLNLLEAQKEDVSEGFYTDVKEWLEGKVAELR